MITILKDLAVARKKFRQITSSGESLGFVPTMGALHQGHLSLIRRAKEENDRVAVSILVNPTQFNSQTDLNSYPQDFEGDRAKLESCGIDILLYPPVEDVYHDDYRYRITENRDSLILEGAGRPGHFEGVMTVVLKLLNIVGPHKAYFGEKDWQQYQLIKDMAEAFFLDTQIIGCELIREDNGLAMSSRNTLLNADERRMAPELHRILTGEGSPMSKKSKLDALGFQTEYVEERDGRLLAAVHLGKVRLIDNVPISRS